MKKSVLFVSKPIVPPFHDGSVCLVAEIAQHVPAYRAVVMTTAEGGALPGEVELDRTYARRGAFAPALLDNARVVRRLLLGKRNDIWHFVFAPNPKSSKVGALAKAIRKVPVVQTVASRPRSFDGVEKLLFGDRIVAVSKHTADDLIRGGADASRVSVIVPPIADKVRSQEQKSLARRELGIAADVPLFCYPGDVEFSSGARTCAQALAALFQKLPDAHFVFACRAKTPRAQQAQSVLMHELSAFKERVHWAGEVRDLPALLGGSTAVVFPVDDLYGKVDLPFAVLEACLLGVPVIVARGGPLTEIAGIVSIAPGGASELAHQCIELAGDCASREQIGQGLRKHVLAHHDPAVIGAQYQEVYRAIG